VPAKASLRGDYAITGNYSPDIRFSVGEQYDFIQSAAFDSGHMTPAGA